MNFCILFLFNFFINSSLVFATTWALVELFLFIFRIKNFRFKYYARLLPLIKVFIDIGIYNFSSWAILQNINPLLCEKGTRTLTIAFTNFSGLTYFFKILMHLPNKLTFTISDILSSIIGKRPTIAIVLLIIIGCFISLIGFITTLVRSKIFHKKLLINFKSMNLETFQDLIKNKTFSNKITFGVVPYQISPSVIRYQKKWFIIFPKNFHDFLSKDEIKSILEHEIQHIVNFDYYFLILLSFLQSILWYNPLILIWRKKISLTKELACDQINKSNPLHLATALKKFAQRSALTYPLMNSFFNNHTLLIRIKNLANLKNKSQHRYIKYLHAGILILVSIFILLSKIWIF